MGFTFLTFICLLTCMTTVSSQFVKDTLGNTRFIAARKGEKPPCQIEPGETFCEDVENYPFELILHAIQRSKMDLDRFLVDETTDNGPDMGFLNDRTQTSDGELSNVLRLPRQAIKKDSFNLPEVNTSTSSWTLEEKHERHINLPDLPDKPDNSSLKEIEFLEQLHNTTITDTTHIRVKRQNFENGNQGSSLCASTVKYIYPKLAMCSRTGEWMYVVNMFVATEGSTQMLRTDVCKPGVEGMSCSGACSGDNVPFGTVSRCEQHFIQKRLVTLAPSDAKSVYTEMFWLPSCCICKTYRTGG